MSLAFLVPLFLLGIAGIVVPIVVHLTRRQRRNVVHFPSLMFLQKIPYQEQRRRRIQHWFLLSLRALALALLAVAFARPFVEDGDLGV
ncbi:MAG: BatA domain-containing protein, partial [Longimicrobiales bacterium]|nr:BatA domain-containing protein [Longimicrobiales bacterium]